MSREAGAPVVKASRAPHRIITDGDNDLWLEYGPDDWVCITDPVYLEALRTKLHNVDWTRKLIENDFGPTFDTLVVKIMHPKGEGL
jgi:hypothetical protein